MKTFYFTFGHGQRYFPGFHKIEAETELGARQIMMGRFGVEWAFCYDSSDKFKDYPEGKIEIVYHA